MFKILYVDRNTYFCNNGGMDGIRVVVPTICTWYWKVHKQYFDYIKYQINQRFYY